MIFHLNDSALQERGFKLVARYECFEKGRRCLNIVCYKSSNAYLVRNFSTNGFAWDDLYESKDKANERVAQLLSLRKHHKRLV